MGQAVSQHAWRASCGMHHRCRGWHCVATPGTHLSVIINRYQSTTLGIFQTLDLIETFVNYHENIKKCICIVYDPQRSNRGSLALKAIRLKEQFIGLFKEQKLTAKDLRDANIGWRDVFQEIPIKVRARMGPQRTEELEMTAVSHILGPGSGHSQQYAAVR